MQSGFGEFCESCIRLHVRQNRQPKANISEMAGQAVLDATRAGTLTKLARSLGDCRPTVLPVLASTHGLSCACCDALPWTLQADAMVLSNHLVATLVPEAAPRPRIGPALVAAWAIHIMRRGLREHRSSVAARTRSQSLKHAQRPRSAVPESLDARLGDIEHVLERKCAPRPQASLSKLHP